MLLLPTLLLLLPSTWGKMECLFTMLVRVIAIPSLGARPSKLSLIFGTQIHQLVESVRPELYLAKIKEPSKSNNLKGVYRFGCTAKWRHLWESSISKTHKKWSKLCKEALTSRKFLNSSPQMNGFMNLKKSNFSTITWHRMNVKSLWSMQLILTLIIS